jgi:hypothetical protein
MAIPNLTLRPGGVLWAEATAVPDNGDNTFQIGIDRVYVPDEDWLEILVQRLGTSVEGFSYVPASLDLSVNPPRITLNFTQSGTDQARVIVRQIHTVVQ